MLEIDFGEDGLVPAVAQDQETGRVLMLAYMNDEALRKTLDTREAHYYSRSRDELWHKGESSGHVQKVKEVLVDCDADSILLEVDQEGGACHTGYYSCFHRTIEGEETGERAFDPDEVY
ncbi:MAG: phosphoribosyl-AMP cyclohydrolase [Halobacteria archaeon]|nr:phosphoribosyl-AMP cyclohydrolase [Halobacteria archaeon]